MKILNKCNAEFFYSGRVLLFLARSLILFFLLTVSFSLSAESTEAEQDQLRDSAVSGDKSAMLKLGDEYFYGSKLRPPNPSLAAYWYLKSAELGAPEGMYNYAVCLQRGAGVDIDRFKAYDWMKKAADTGLKPARLQLAMMDLDGIPEDKKRGIPAKSPLTTFALNQIALLAEEQYIPAETIYAQLLLTQNNPAAEAKAVRILTRLTSLKDPPPAALRMLADCKYSGRGVKRDPEEMLRLLRQAARQGDAESLGKLAFCYEYGRGVAVDEKKAFQLYRLSAERGNAMSQFKYAEFIANGTVSKNPDIHSALPWYEKAAAQRNPQALFKLGVFNLEGIGMAKDERKASRFFFESATRGYPRAQYNLGCLYAVGSGDLVKDDSAAVYWFTLAANGGDAVAQRALALRYFEGRGVPRSITKGEEWLQKAAQNGDPEAVGLMRRRGLASPSGW